MILRISQTSESPRNFFHSRPGSVIVDAEVYYLNVTKNTKETICSQLKSLSTADSGTSLQIANVETVSYGTYLWTQYFAVVHDYKFMLINDISRV